MPDVLVVDDEESIRFSFDRILSDAGYRVYTAEHETRAWEVLSSREMDVAIVDRILGNGQNGIDLVKKIREKSPFCETILVSGYPTFESAAETMGHGVFAYLAKPLKRKQICEKVAGAVEKSQKKREADRYGKTLKSLFDHTSHAVLITDLFHRVRFVNPAFERIFGYSGKDIHGEKVPIVPDWDRAETGAEIEALLAGRALPERKTKRLDVFGRPKHVAVSSSLIRNGEGDACDILFIIRDQREIRTVQKQLQLAQKMENLGFLAGGIAHNFGNTLYIIRSYADMAIQEPSLNHPFTKYFMEIFRASGHALELVNQLRTFSRFSDSGLAKTHIRPIIIDMIKMLGPIFPKTIDIRAELVSDCPKIMADDSRIRQLFVNLCVNAKDAMSENGGILRIVLDTEEKCPVGENGTPSPHVRLTVSDTGCGMPPEIAERIFEPLFSTKEEGTGLGLSMVRSIVESHGGTIEVDSRPGEGTAFHVWFPALEKKGPQNEQDDHDSG